MLVMGKWLSTQDIIGRGQDILVLSIIVWSSFFVAVVSSVSFKHVKHLFITYYYICACVCMCYPSAHMLWHPSEGQRTTCGSQFFYPTMRVQGIEFRLSGLSSSAFMY